MSDIEITTAGQRFTGWERAEVTRTVQSATGRFQVTVAGRSDLWDLNSDDVVRVSVDGETVLTGRVDGVSGVLGTNQNDMSIVGRGLVGELVDCAPRLTGDSDDGPTESPSRLWIDAGVEEVVRQVAASYGIEVDWRLGPAVIQPFRKLEARIGDTCWRVIERALRRRGLLGFEDAEGRLVVAEPTASERATRGIATGEFRTARSVVDHSGRFRFYRVFGQVSPWEALLGDYAARSIGTAQDASIRAPRTRVLVAEGGSDSDTAFRRAAWEASVAATRGSLAIVSMHGWRETEGGRLWAPNRLVSLNIPELGLEGDRLILTARYLRDESGEVTELELGRLDAFRVEEEQPTGFEGLLQ